MADKIRPAKVVFACVANAGRSQMAAAFLNTLADPTRARAMSAGTRPDEWPLDDPKGQPVETVRRVRNEIRTLGRS